MKKIFQTKGFTLVEMLVVTAVFVVISTIILSIFIITFRGSRKSEVLVALKQNGNFANSQMVKQIRFAKSVDAPASCTPTVSQSFLTITSAADSKQTTFSCPVSQADGIASNSASLIDTNAVAVSACSFTCTQQNASQPPTITIRFTLSQKAVSSLAENASTIPFETSVTLRN